MWRVTSSNKAWNCLNHLHIPQTDYSSFTPGQHWIVWRKVNYSNSAPLHWRLRYTHFEWLIPGALISTTQTSHRPFSPAGGLLLFTASPQNEGALKVQPGNSFCDRYVPLTAGHPHFIPTVDCYYLRMSFCGSGPFLSINAAFSQPTIRSLLRPLLSAWAAALHLLITGASRLPQTNHYPS